MAPFDRVEQWPDNLRFDGGDVLVRFSDDTSQHLLLHRNVLAAQSPVFDAMLSRRWHEPKLFVDGQGKEKAVWLLDLVLDREEGITYLACAARTTLLHERPMLT